MPLVNAKCTNCGANLEVDNAQDAAICKFCGSAFIVEKAINNYNVTNNIKADVVNIYGSQNSDFIIRAGVLEKYNGESTSVIIPENVTHIGAEAFKGCLGLLEITISKNVQNIDPHSFNTCTSLRAINVCNDNCFYSSSDGVLLNKNKTTLLRCPIGKTGEYTIPGSVVEISGSDDYFSIKSEWVAFSYSSLTSVVIPNNIKKIGCYAFRDSSLERVTISEGVEEIKKKAFDYCKNLKTVTLLGDKIKGIDRSAFGYEYDERWPFTEEVRCLPKVARKLKRDDGGPFTGSKWANNGCHPYCIKCGKKLNLFGKCPNCG